MRHRARVWSTAFVLATAAFAACAFDWDSFDPRLAPQQAASNASSASAGGAGGIAPVGGGGSGGVPSTPGEVVCHVLTGGWGRAVAAHPDGGFAVVGSFHGTVQLGGDPLVSAGEDDGFVARFGPNCEHVFSARSGGPEQYEGTEAVVVLPGGDIVVMGDFAANADLFGMPVTAIGQHDSFVARLDPMGAVVWLKTFGSTGGEWGRALATDESGNIFVTGHFHGTLNAGGGALTSLGEEDIWLAKFDGTGAHQWSMRYGSVSFDRVRSLAVDATGHLILAGFHCGPLQIGTTTVPFVGDHDGYVLELDGQGGLVWARGFSSPEASAREYVQTAVPRSDGHIVLVGRFDTSLDVGMANLVSAGQGDAFLAELDGDGAPLWARSFGGPGNDRAADIALDDSGNIVIGGVFQGQIDLGAGLVGDPNADNVYAARLDPAGRLAWARVFPAPGSDYTKGLGVAYAQNGDVLFSGYASAPIDFGMGASTQGSGFVVRLSN